MRVILILPFFAMAPAFAQPAAGTGGDACKVISRPLDVNAAGEIYQPPPSTDDCAAADALVEKFQSMGPRDFDQIVAVEGIPGPVHVYVGPLRPYGMPRPIDSPPGSLPLQRHIATFRSDKLVIVVYETSDFSGPTTTVVIADLETLTVCTYASWPDNEDPATLRIPEIQAVLDEDHVDRFGTPTCRLGTLPIEDVE